MDAMNDMAAGTGTMGGVEENGEGGSTLMQQAQALLDRFMHDPNDPASASDALLKAAALYEREELVFRNKSSDVFSRERESYPVWE